jgi:hypothetical protein
VLEDGTYDAIVVDAHAGDDGAECEEQRGEQDLAELDLHVRPLGDPQRLVARLGDLLEQVPHLGGGHQVVLRAVELDTIGIGQQRARLDAQQGPVGLVVLPVGVMRVVGR